MSDWYHEVDPLWLEARKSVITATEIKSLVPEYNRAKKKGTLGDILPGFAALWAEKSSNTMLDVVSRGAAARGHVMEPYAVGYYNKYSDITMYHWDDSIIVNNGMGFSADALDIPWEGFIKLTVKGNELQGPLLDGKQRLGPKHGVEVKSYEPAHHMKCCLKKKMEHDELMQLAVAFIVCPTLETMTLLFFCPGAPIPMHMEEYTREELKELIEEAQEINKIYYEIAGKLAKMQSKYVVEETELDIWRETYHPDAISEFTITR